MFTKDGKLDMTLLLKGVTYPTRVLVDDRVKTRTGRHGVVAGTTGGDTSTVNWDNGESFSIRNCHLEVLSHGQPKGLKVSGK